MIPIGRCAGTRARKNAHSSLLRSMTPPVGLNAASRRLTICLENSSVGFGAGAVGTAVGAGWAAATEASNWPLPDEESETVSSTTSAFVTTAATASAGNAVRTALSIAVVSRRSSSMARQLVHMCFTNSGISADSLGLSCCPACFPSAWWAPAYASTAESSLSPISLRSSLSAWWSARTLLAGKSRTPCSPSSAVASDLPLPGNADAESFVRSLASATVFGDDCDDFSPFSPLSWSRSRSRSRSLRALTGFSASVGAASAGAEGAGADSRYMSTNDFSRPYPPSSNPLSRPMSIQSMLGYHCITTVPASFCRARSRSTCAASDDASGAQHSEAYGGTCSRRYLWSRRTLAAHPSLLNSHTRVSR
eukprot:Opistho-2@47322